MSLHEAIVFILYSLLINILEVDIVRELHFYWSFRRGKPWNSWKWFLCCLFIYASILCLFFWIYLTFCNFRSWFVHPCILPVYLGVSSFIINESLLLIKKSYAFFLLIYIYIYIYFFSHVIMIFICRLPVWWNTWWPIWSHCCSWERCLFYCSSCKES